ncbi:otogelin-like [Stylophora pistillata]|uniref:otogelin-like n=1 Tax=Stylophora pistillata TaxID=50429 RepID=UPI000C03C469|nr:otogelin-like [Stylophora pistillata]
MMAAAFFLGLILALFQPIVFARVPSPFLHNNAQEKPCFHGDSIYDPWERFADESCTGWCSCNGRTGHVGCVSLCPPRGLPTCSLGEVPEETEEPSVDPTGRCKCKRKSCLPRLSLPPPPPLVKTPEEHVLPECKNRAPKEWFINDSCTGRCRCQYGGIACVSLCPPMVVKCPSSMEEEAYDHPVDNTGKCTCKRRRCVSKVGA